MNVNKAIIVGRLTANPELRATPSGQSVTSFSVATSTTWKDQNGMQQQKTEFHNVVVWGRRAEVIAQYFVKGQEIFLEGRLETRSWDDRDTGKKMYRTEIILENFDFGSKPQTSSYDNQSQQNYGVSNNVGQQYNQENSTPPQTAMQKQDKKIKQEDEIPTINLEDEEEIKIEDIPF